eukprot:s1447_g19.t1
MLLASAMEIHPDTMPLARSVAPTRSTPNATARVQRAMRPSAHGKDGKTFLCVSLACSGIALAQRSRSRQQSRHALQAQASSAAEGEKGRSRPRVAVVGAGWGGLGAAKALCENGCEVTLLDGTPQPGSGMQTPSGKPFEAGTRGFWRDYPNMNATLAKIGLDESELFTDFTESAFYSPDGLEATAPVFAGAPELPSPLGQVIASFSRFRRLPLADRLSITGLLLAMVDFTRDAKTFEAYDRMTAHELFLRAGLSRRLVDDFLKPTLLVGLFKPPEELSAAVTMELLYFYALAHQTSFDVRWLKKGTVSETLMCPVINHLVNQHGLTVKGGCFVEGLEVVDGEVTGLRYRSRSAGSGGSVHMEDLDAVVLALGAGGLRAVLRGSPEVAKLCPNLTSAGSLQGIDVMSVRIWFDRKVATQAPANVFAKFSALRGAGGTFFMLDQLQADQQALWGEDEPQGSVVACDFYNAGALLALSDEEIIRLLTEELLPSAVPEFRSAKVVDSHAMRFPGGVSWFSPGSFKSRPTTETPLRNLVCAGDWVRLGSREHGAKGLCQERALVTGLEAANSLARRGILGKCVREHTVIPVRDDELQVQVARSVNRTPLLLWTAMYQYQDIEEDGSGSDFLSEDNQQPRTRTTVWRVAGLSATLFLVAAALLTIPASAPLKAKIEGVMAKSDNWIMSGVFTPMTLPASVAGPSAIAPKADLYDGNPCNDDEDLNDYAAAKRNSKAFAIRSVRFLLMAHTTFGPPPSPVVQQRRLRNAGSTTRK